MPSPQEWQAAITRHGFPLKISTDFDVVALRGLLPCEYHGQPCGFEYHYSICGQEDLRELGIPESLPCQILFFTGTRPKENFLSEIIAAAALAEMTGGVLVDPQEDTTLEGAQAVEWCRRQAQIYLNLNTAPRVRANASSFSRPKPLKLFLYSLFFAGMGVAFLLTEKSLGARLLALAAILFGGLGFVACGLATLEAIKRRRQGLDHRSMKTSDPKKVEPQRAVFQALEKCPVKFSKAWKKRP